MGRYWDEREPGRVMERYWDGWVLGQEGTGMGKYWDERVLGWVTGGYWDRRALGR